MDDIVDEQTGKLLRFLGARGIHAGTAVAKASALKSSFVHEADGNLLRWLAPLARST